MDTLSTLEKLQSANTRADVALILGIKLKDLTYLLYKKSKGLNYSTFEIPKKGGGVRQINAPQEGLKDLQRRLATLMLESLDEISVAHDTPNTVSHGFMPGRSIFTNGYLHRKKRYVFNIDLKDFFGSITGARIRGFLIKDRSFELKPDVATILAQIATHDGKLPQGSPSSPIISNLLGQILDMHLVRLASQNGCAYTRYADDLSFSTNKRVFPSAIAVLGNDHRWTVGKQLRGLIAKCDFEINDAKTRMQYRTSRQEVTGLVTNSKVNIRSEYRHDVRAKVHHLLNNGYYYERVPVAGGGEGAAEARVLGTLKQLHGKLGFIHTMDKFNWAQMREHGYNYPLFRSEKKTGNESMYLRFLLYKLLYANTEPLLICEGKTDNVYLSRAIHALQSKFPSLTRSDASGKTVLSVRLFKYADTSTGEIFGTRAGGSGGLTKLMEIYLRECSKFKAPPGDHPVIFVIDNDSGATDKGAVYDKIKTITKKRPTGLEDFIHIAKNVYVVATPLNGADSSCIEDLFTAADKAIEINGRTFDPTENLDHSLYYNKATFAYQVVEKNDKIQYHLFEPFLENIVKAITHYSLSPEAGGVATVGAIVISPPATLPAAPSASSP